MSNTYGNKGITEQPTNMCAVVTGGNKGIGLEICRQLAASGVFVILTARDEKRGLDAVENLKGSGLSKVVYHQLDIKDSSSIASLADFVATRFTKLDILINNAADLGLVIQPDAFRALPHGFGDVKDENPELVKGMMEQTYEKAEDCLKINYYGTKAVTEALLPFLQLSSSAKIVNVSSGYGLLMYIHNEEVKSELNNVESLTEERLDTLLQSFLRDFKEGKLQANGWPITVSAYKISKAAVNAYTRMLARKLPDMRINCVHPGYVKTDITCNTGLLTAEEGAKGPVQLALLPDNGPTGHFFYEMNMSNFSISNTFLKFEEGVNLQQKATIKWRRCRFRSRSNKEIKETRFPSYRPSYYFPYYVFLFIFHIDLPSFLTGLFLGTCPLKVRPWSFNQEQRTKNLLA